MAPLTRATWLDNPKVTEFPGCIYFPDSDTFCYSRGDAIEHLAELWVDDLTETFPFACEKVKPELPDIAELIREQVDGDISLNDDSELDYPNMEPVQALAQRIWEESGPAYWETTNKPYDPTELLTDVLAMRARWKAQHVKTLQENNKKTPDGLYHKYHVSGGDAPLVTWCFVLEDKHKWTGDALEAYTEAAGKLPPGAETYTVTRVDDQPIGEYWVLDQADPHAVAALQSVVDSCLSPGEGQETLVMLAHQLQTKIRLMEANIRFEEELGGL